MNINKKDIFIDSLSKLLTSKGFNVSAGDFVSAKQEEICQGLQDNLIILLDKVGMKDMNLTIIDNMLNDDYATIYDWINEYVFNLITEVNKETEFQLTAEQIEEFLINIEENNILHEQLSNI